MNDVSLEDRTGVVTCRESKRVLFVAPENRTGAAPALPPDDVEEAPGAEFLSWAKTFFRNVGSAIKQRRICCATQRYGNSTCIGLS